MRSYHKKTSVQQRPKQEEFLMEPLPTNARPYYRSRISLQLKTSTKKKGRESLQNCYPIFNNDGLHYTPSFLLDSDKDAYQILDEMMKNQYIEKLRNSQEKSTNSMTLNQQISTAHPNSKVCFVCKAPYTDYDKHIEELSHKNNVKKSDYSALIELLCEEFRQQVMKIEAPEKQEKEFVLLQLSDQSESFNQLPKIPILTPFDDFFQQSPQLKYH